jgi:putative endonuclease
LKITAQELGKWGEKLAADYLIKQGYSILAKNARTPFGELDLVAEQPDADTPGDDSIVFVEVKTRRSQSFGYPEESITASKREHIISAALHFLQEHPDLDCDWRIDVIAIEKFKNQEPIIHHIENAINEP